MKILALVGISVALLFASFRSFSPDRITRLTGVVTAVTGDSLTLDLAGDASETMTIEVLRSTLFLQDGQSASWRDLTVGAQADVDASGNGDNLYAINVSFEKQRPFHGHTGASPSRQAQSYDAYWHVGASWRTENGLCAS